MPGAFLDRDAPPSRDDLARVLGDALPMWDRVAGAIEAAYGIAPEPLRFGRESGWAVRYRRAGRSLVVLLPEPGAVRAVVVLGPSIQPLVEGLSLDPSVRAAFESAHAYPDGRWLRLDVTSARIADDVVRLVMLKSPPPKRPRESRAAATDSG